MVRLRDLLIVALALMGLLAWTNSAHASCSHAEMLYLQDLTNRWVNAIMQADFAQLQDLELEAQQRLSPACYNALAQAQNNQPRYPQYPYGGMQRDPTYHQGPGGSIIGPDVGCDSTGCYSFGD